MKFYNFGFQYDNINSLLLFFKFNFNFRKFIYEKWHIQIKF
jgi:hypothetical protein